MAVVSGAATCISLDVASEIQRGRSPGRSLIRNALVVGQVGLSILLVTGAVLFACSLNTARAIDLGFETERRLIVGVNFPNHGYDRSRAMTFIESAIPLVLAAVACVASFLPARRATRVDPMVALRSD